MSHTLRTVGQGSDLKEESVKGRGRERKGGREGAREGGEGRYMYELKMGGVAMSKRVGNER